jgi:RNA polymerase sigma factor (TIGR02999 family)
MNGGNEPEQPDKTGSTETDSVGELLKRVATGRQASGEAYALLKAQLKEIAQRQMTAADELSVEASHVVNAVYVKLAGAPDISWKDREQFLRYACMEIRTFLVDKADKRNAMKRGGGRIGTDPAKMEDPPSNLCDPAKAAEKNDDLLLLMDKALPELEKSHPDLAQVVYLHFFGGLNFERIGPLLGIDPGTALRRWKKAQILLQRDMNQLASSDDD